LRETTKSRDLTKRDKIKGRKNLEYKGAIEKIYGKEGFDKFQKKR